MAAVRQVLSNKGAPGVDGVTVDQIVDAEGSPQIIVDVLHEELRTKRYRPQPVRRVMIPKPDGRERPLGIPTVRDRIVQTAALLILEPIFEADFLDCSYGFRPKRSAHDALSEVRELIKSGRGTVYDADLKGYFDSIPHDKLMAALQVRISDRSVLHLIRMWLEAAVVDSREGGPPRRQSQGTPQGGVISPLLANVYLHWFDRAFHGVNGPATFANARLVRYADDLVVLARHVGRRMVEWIESTLERRLGLELNREKTRVVQLRGGRESVSFLGYTFQYFRDLKGRPWMYLNASPSKKALGRARSRLRELTATRHSFKPIPVLIQELNAYTGGWQQYFSFGYPKMAWRHVDWQLRERLKRHLRRRSQRPFRSPAGQSYYSHFQQMGLRYLALDRAGPRACLR
jgi:RNA-directed DNA polymerase